MNDSKYQNIARKIDDIPQTAPKEKDNINFHSAFIEYLKLIYLPEEADVIQHLNAPPAFVSVQEVVDKSGIDLVSVTQILKAVHKKNAVMGMGDAYCLPPIQLLVNIHQFHLEIKPGDLKAAQLYQEFFIEGGYYKYYETSEKGTPSLRTIPVEKAIQAEQKILSAEEAHDLILNHSSEELSLVSCPCRVRTEKIGIRECKDKFPIASCIMIGFSSLHFESLGLGKKITREQAIEYFDKMNEIGLVGNVTNAINNIHIICMCCGCCCSHTRGRTRWDNPNAILPSNFVPESGEDCLGCGACTDKCFFGALAVNDETGKAVVQADQCIGCGVCTFACPQDTLKLHRYERSTPFATSDELYETIARENRE